MSANTSPTPVVLVAHGSPRPGWRVPLDALVDRLRASGRPSALALLTESDSLDAAIADLSREGATRVVIVPALLCRGRHLDEDIPAWIADARARHPGVAIEFEPRALAEHDLVLDVLAAVVAQITDAV